MRVGVTGHMNLSDESVPLVAEAVRAHLATLDVPSLVGVSCLARGADSVFAEVVIELGGRLEVVLPSSNYREAKVKPDHVPQFDRLLTQASEVKTMPFDTANRDAYVAANEAVLGTVDQLVAVWDGRPSPDRGGTAGAVEEARARGVKVKVIWPEGATRS
ncbi:MAG TPA: hypothetical protein VL551_14715 [Actinospica sp.]|jgi:hypothetical protein|nr:hypothetical protein [Actinospica sp.]